MQLLYFKEWEKIKPDLLPGHTYFFFAKEPSTDTASWNGWCEIQKVQCEMCADHVSLVVVDVTERNSGENVTSIQHMEGRQRNVEW
ncbi:hypothetical protein P8C59_007433 [Phyllachora maydis]|uniref:Uncharacterized protein n=1 Tax=Phyllachora maydis TaxID=1825666 RepID=A0AAD9I9P5_9PEZI|nr:hypothetical protein P8C59_007433 [Phyllachora maydis]